METIYDWITLAVFAGIVVLFLQRSMDKEQNPNDRMIHYLVPSVACAVANYLGNEGYMIPAVLVLIAGLAYFFHFLRPFGYPR